MTVTQVINASINASWLVLAVMVLRLVLKSAPKALHCALWGLVAVRLLCPVSIESDWSLIPSSQVIPQDYLTMEGNQLFDPAVLEIVDNPAYPEDVEIPLNTTVDRLQIWDLAGTLVWIAGMCVMGLYALFSYLSLRLRLRFATPEGEGVFACDEITSPFILGVFRPRIYLPSALDAQIRVHVLAHERAHLQRLDHIWKPLGFALLTVHWFNPLMWAAYILLCRDIELACDEKVIRSMDKSGIRSYSEALVACSVSPRMIAACPLAFGEVGVKDRVRSMLHYKKPGFWVLTLAVAASILAAVGFLTDPLPAAPELGRICSEKGYQITQQQEQGIYVMLYKDWLPENVLNGDEHRLDDDPITVWRSEETNLNLIAAQMTGDELLLTFSFQYALPESGQIMLPYMVNDCEKVWTIAVEGGRAHDYRTDYAGAAQLSHYGTDTQFSVRVDAEVYENADDYLAFTLSGANCLTYVSDQTDITPLMGKRYAVEACLYSNPDYGYQESDIPQYQVGTDLRLNIHQSGQWERSCSLGALEPVELTQEQFDRLFFGEYWLTNELQAAKLRRANASAWICHTEFTSPQVTHLLLHQKNGDVYMVVMAEQGDIITDLFRLTPVESQPQTETVCIFAATLGNGEAAAPLYLHSDGTFSYSESLYSSYLYYGNYALDGDTLVTRTMDGRYTWYFAVVGESLVYDADRSDPMRYAAGVGPYVKIADGTIFNPNVG